jgi:hypothetical protein
MRKRYDGVVDTPKTPKSVRTIPLTGILVQLLKDWRFRSKRTKPEDFILAGRLSVPGTAWEVNLNICAQHVLQPPNFVN